MHPPKPPHHAGAVARRTQAARRAESNHNLLRAAATLIATEGVQAATLQRIGLRAGYSRGLATQKFGSKQGLIEALIAHLHTRLEALMQDRSIEAAPGLDGVLAFADMFLRELAADDEVRAYFMLMASTVADLAPARAAFAASHSQVGQRLQALLAKGQADGSVTRALPAHTAAIWVGSTLLGLTTQRLIDPAMDLPAMRHATVAALRLALRA